MLEARETYPVVGIKFGNIRVIETHRRRLTTRLQFVHEQLERLHRERYRRKLRGSYRTNQRVSVIALYCTV